MHSASYLVLCLSVASLLESAVAGPANGQRVLLPAGKTTSVPLSERLKRIAVFETELENVANANIPSKVPLDYKVNGDILEKEANALIRKFGTTMEFYQLQYTLAGVHHGAWTCLSIKAKDGDMCDDSTVYYPGSYKSTQVWKEAPAIRQLLQPIEFALRRVRFSVMQPSTMVSWHCDDCPHAYLSPPGFPGHAKPAVLRKAWKNRFHRWVRLHLMLSSNEDVEFGIGGLKVHGSSSGVFYLANIAMPHRVDNKGSSSRTALLVDVRIQGMKTKLRNTELGRSILKAVKTITKVDGSQTYLKMGHALYRYACGLTDAERFETEWHRKAWSKPLWSPSLPLRSDMFNHYPDRCGILGQRKNRQQLQLLLEQPPDEGLNVAARPARKASRRRRRRSRQDRQAAGKY